MKQLAARSRRPHVVWAEPETTPYTSLLSRVRLLCPNCMRMLSFFALKKYNTEHNTSKKQDTIQYSKQYNNKKHLSANPRRNTWPRSQKLANYCTCNGGIRNIARQKRRLLRAMGRMARHGTETRAAERER